MMPREPGFLGKKIFLVPVVLYLVFVALVVGSWWLGHRTEWDMSVVVGTGRKRGPAWFAMTMSCSLAVLTLAYAIHWTRRAIHTYKTYNSGRVEAP
jgi:hypothetical protein